MLTRRLPSPVHTKQADNNDALYEMVTLENLSHLGTFFPNREGRRKNRKIIMKNRFIS